MAEMIRIKAPRVWSADPPGKKRAGRWYSEPMHRRVLALVRACEEMDMRDRLASPAANALWSLKEQAEKEAGK